MYLFILVEIMVLVTNNSSISLGIIRIILYLINLIKL